MDNNVNPGSPVVSDDGNNLVPQMATSVEQAKRGVKPDQDVVDALMHTYKSVIGHPNQNNNWGNLNTWREVEVEDYKQDFVKNEEGQFLYFDKYGKEKTLVTESEAKSKGIGHWLTNWTLRRGTEKVQKSTPLYAIKRSNGQREWYEETDHTMLPDTLLGAGLCQDMRRFSPPDRVQKKEYVRGNVEAYWTEFAVMVLAEAERRSILQPAVITGLKQYESETIHDIKNTHNRYTVGDRNTVPLHFDVDTTTPQSSSEIQREIEKVLSAGRAVIRKGVESVLADAEFIEARRKTFEVKHFVDASVVLAENVALINYLRSEVEHPEEVNRFLDIARQVIELLGYSDVDVELLSTEDAITRHCIGLYTPAKDGKRAKISLPMSRYGTRGMMPIKDTLDTIAHEVAHHDMAVLGSNVDMTGHLVHGFTHDALTARREEQVGRLSIMPVQNDDGTVGLEVIRDPAKDSLLRHASLVQAIRDEMATLTSVVQQQLGAMPPRPALPAASEESGREVIPVPVRLPVQQSAEMSNADRTQLATSVATEVAQRLAPTVGVVVRQAMNAQKPPAKKPWWKIFG